MFDKIMQLKNKGYYPDTVLDIGAYHGEWTRYMQRIFSCKYYLFEAIDYPQLTHCSPGVEVFNVVLNNTAKEITWYQRKNTGDSMFREKSHHFASCDIIKRPSIDLNTLCKEKGILHNSKSIFIKIDCQGAEIPILQGATDILHKTNFIVLEIPFFGQYNEGVPNFLEHVRFMDTIGFLPYDIVDNHYINGFNMQIDMLFINKNHRFTKDVNALLV